MKEPAGSPKVEAVFRRVIEKTVTGVQVVYIEVASGFESMGFAKLVARQLALENPGDVYVAAKLSPAVAVKKCYEKKAYYPDYADAQVPAKTGSQVKKMDPRKRIAA